MRASPAVSMVALVWVVSACGSRQAATQTTEPVQPTPAAGQPTATGQPSAPTEAAGQATPVADHYRDIAATIIAAARKDQDGWNKLVHLTDRIGHRLSGSPSLDQAIAWAAAAMKADGHQVTTEKVMVPSWQRGAESGRIIAPVVRPLHLIGLGGSGSTGKRKLVGEVVVVRDFDELAALGDKVAGKIVLFDRPMPPYDEEKGAGYGETSPYRTQGPSRAAQLGAKAALVRSVTAHSLRTPHTGYTGFEEGVKPIPAAAVSTEDASLIARLAASGEPVKVELTLISKWNRDAESANVIGEIRGREKPDEVVLIGAHIDSWDVGQGAHDDAAGCVIVMQALTLIRKLGLEPRRTIRVVLFTNEENGLRGAEQYATNQGDKVKNHVVALEADTGGFAPQGVRVKAGPQVLQRMRDIVSLLEPIDAARAKEGYAGADVGPLVAAGVPGLGLWMDGSRYFDYHHSEADTLDKVDPEDIRKDIAAVAVIAYVIADMEQRLDQLGPAAEPSAE